ncbi:Class III cytochrome C family protein [Desulfatibacillum alkenivorans DSM 16219]|jgi:hypothetical protein|uniref:Class III cytochrome C family protein n=1 Tax=Desulfatibacillum alkenivorans DSM 16219 TaxID=1121393 RepID=A0A1M6KJ05_9BACT|nr:cytochrome c3 family protein [Desulfatibacillum alkenivorans]SHJ58879.1 Class III cytochrome C family protein [Desulfatibacillum alkenivorans DSM 16219]
MDKNKERLLALCLMAALFLVGAVCYAAYSQEEPNRILLDFGGGQGKVMFGHYEHFEDFDVACIDCHHTAEDELSEMQKCGDCHLKSMPKGDPCVARKDAFHNQCIGCHEDIGMDLACGDCHVK